MLQLRLRDRREVNLQLQFPRLCDEGFLKAGKILPSRNLDQQTERECFMHDRLPNIEHAGIITGQNCS